MSSKKTFHYTIMEYLLAARAVRFWPTKFKGLGKWINGNRKKVKIQGPCTSVYPNETHSRRPAVTLKLISLCHASLLVQTVRHGFPYQPSSMAFDPVQKILAMGTQSGALRLYPFLNAAAKLPRITVTSPPSSKFPKGKWTAAFMCLCHDVLEDVLAWGSARSWTLDVSLWWNINSLKA